MVNLKSFNDNNSIDILVGTKDAKQISLAKEGISLPRPSTHDLLLDIVESFNVKVKKIIITDYKSSVYFSKIVLHNISLGEIQIDCRPSDGIIISLKLNAPLYVSEKIFNILMIDDVSNRSYSTDKEADSRISLKKLNKSLSKAIIEEEYEIAAKLRDQIKDFSKKLKNK